MKVQLTRRLIMKHFGPKAKVRPRLRGGFLVRMPNGGRVVVTERGWRDLEGGADVTEAVVSLYHKLGKGGVWVHGPIEKIAHVVQAGQKLGIPVTPSGQERWFGLVKTPPPNLPLPSGVHGDQALDSDAKALRSAGLLGPRPGEGVRIGACWETGEALRYVGENSIIGFGPPGSGKGVCFQSVAALEFDGSQVFVDPSAQLFMLCAPELKRRGFRVIPIMPFVEGFPAEVAALANQTRCLNAMDLLTPGESFDADRLELAQLLRPEEKGASGDPFFNLSGRALIVLDIGCVKLYAHPAEQNLCEVYHKLGDWFNYARSLMGKPGMPRTISTPLRRWAAPGAENDRTLRSIVETALADLSWLGDEALERVQRMSSFAWDDLKNGSRPIAVFILLPVNKLESHKAYLTLCCGAALMGLSKTERGKRRVLVTVDEAALLGYMPIIQRGFAELRKRGAQLSVWFQSIYQAESLYGPAWKNMLSGSDIQVHLRPRDLGSAEFISHQIGNYTEIVPHFSHGEGPGGKPKETVAFGEQGRPVLFPQDIMALPDHPRGGSAAILIAPGRSRNALKIWARPWFECPDLKHKGGVDAYHRHREKGNI
jgi:type IV secretory pathway TraG/TraD family ATPase VirD4